MLNIDEKVVDKKGQIFYISEIVKKDFGTGEKSYYCLLPFYKENFTNNYMSFIPVEGSENLIRPIFTKEESLKLIDSLKDIESYGEIPPRNRKSYFEDVLATGGKYEACRIIKTLYEYREEKALINKTLTDYENKLLKDLNKIVIEELATSLEVDINEVPTIVEKELTFPFFNC